MSCFTDSAVRFEQKTALVVTVDGVEGERLKQMLEPAGVGVHLVYGSSCATPARIRYYLLNESIDWLVISARHGSLNGETLWLSGNHRIKLSSTILRMPRTPEFVCLLACNTWYLGTCFANMKPGRRLVLATATDMVPSGSYLLFAERFFEAILAGKTGRQALKHARKRFEQHFPNDRTPNQFAVLGDEDYRIMQRADVRQPVRQAQSVAWADSINGIQYARFVETCGPAARPPDIYTSLEIGLRTLLSRLEHDHRHYADALTYQRWLNDNIARAREQGERNWIKSEREAIILSLDALAISTLATTFLSLCSDAAPGSALAPRVNTSSTTGEELDVAGAGVLPQRSPLQYIAARIDMEQMVDSSTDTLARYSAIGGDDEMISVAQSALTARLSIAETARLEMGVNIEQLNEAIAIPHLQVAIPEGVRPSGNTISGTPARRRHISPHARRRMTNGRRRTESHKVRVPHRVSGPTYGTPLSVIERVKYTIRSFYLLLYLAVFHQDKRDD